MMTTVSTDDYFAAALKCPPLAFAARRHEQRAAAHEKRGASADDNDADDADDDQDASSSSSSSSSTAASITESDTDTDTHHPALRIPELLLQVLARVDPPTLVRSCSSVCRGWRCAALDASLWSPLLGREVLAAVEEEGEQGEASSPMLLPRLYFGLYRRNLIRNPRFVRRLNGGGAASGGGGSSIGRGRAGRAQQPQQQQQQQQQQSDLLPAWTVATTAQPSWECPPAGLSPHVFLPPPPLPHPSSCGEGRGEGGGGDGREGGGGSGAAAALSGGGFLHRWFPQWMAAAGPPPPSAAGASPRSFPTHVGGAAAGGGGPEQRRRQQQQQRPPSPPAPSPPPPSPPRARLVPCLAAPACAWCEVVQVVDLRAELMRRAPGLSASAAERLLDAGLFLGAVVWVAAPEAPSSCGPAALLLPCSLPPPSPPRSPSSPPSPSSGPCCPFALSLRLDEGEGCGDDDDAPPASNNPFAADGDGAGAGAGATAAAAAFATTALVDAAPRGPAPRRRLLPSSSSSSSSPRFTSFAAYVRRPSAHHFYSRRLAAVPGQWRRFAYAVEVPPGCRRAVFMLRGRGPGGETIGGGGGGGSGGSGGNGGGVKFASAQLSFLPADEVRAFGADDCIASWEGRRMF